MELSIVEKTIRERELKNEKWVSYFRVIFIGIYAILDFINYFKLVDMNFPETSIVSLIMIQNIPRASSANPSQLTIPAIVYQCKIISTSRVDTCTLKYLSSSISLFLGFITPL